MQTGCTATMLRAQNIKIIRRFDKNPKKEQFARIVPSSFSHSAECQNVRVKKLQASFISSFSILTSSFSRSVLAGPFMSPIVIKRNKLAIYFDDFALARKNLGNLYHLLNRDFSTKRGIQVVVHWTFFFLAESERIFLACFQRLKSIESRAELVRGMYS